MKKARCSSKILVGILILVPFFSTVGTFHLTDAQQTSLSKLRLIKAFVQLKAQNTLQKFFRSLDDRDRDTMHVIIGKFGCYLSHFCSLYVPLFCMQMGFPVANCTGDSFIIFLVVLPRSGLANFGGGYIPKLPGINNAA